MPRRYTMTDLILRAQQRCDKERDKLIGRPEWCRLISEAYGELYTIVFEAGLEYFEYAQNLTTDGTNVLAETPDHLSTVVLAWLRAGTTDRYVDLRELMAQERSSYSGVTGACAEFFALVDDKIYLYPTPPSGQTYQLRYVPQPPELVETYQDADVLVDVVTPDGLSFLLWGVAVLAHAKSETDPQLAINRLEAARDRFTKSVQLRALNAPRRRVIDFGVDGDGERFGW